MSKIAEALNKASTHKYRNSSPAKVYQAASNALDNTAGKSSPKIPARVYVIALVVSILSASALTASAFTLAKLDEQKHLALNLQSTSKAQAARIQDVTSVQQSQKEDIALNFKRVNKISEENHRQYVDVMSENGALKSAVGNLQHKVSLLSAEVSTLKSDNAILSNAQEDIHQKLLALKEKVRDIKNMKLDNPLLPKEKTTEPEYTIPQEGN